MLSVPPLLGPGIEDEKATLKDKGDKNQICRVRKIDLEMEASGHSRQRFELETGKD